MACVSCQGYEKRISNVFRDEELKEKFENLIGYRILFDCFICDNCNDKLQELVEFKSTCIQVYKKNNPNYQNHEKLLENVEENEYLILQATDQVFINDEQAENQVLDDHFTVFELNTNEKEMHVEETKSQPKKSEKLKRERQSKRVIIENQSESDDNLTNEELLASISDDQNLSFKVENSNYGESSNKKGRKSYTVLQKLGIIEYSERFSNREAARKFNLNESTIRCFKRQKEVLLGMDPKKYTNRHGTPYWPELEAELKEWTVKQPNKPKMNDVREEALNIARKYGYSNFSGSNTYIFKFMQRNNIEMASPRPRKKLKNELSTNAPAKS